MDASKHSIGGATNAPFKQFERTNYTIQKGDRIYLYSDGFYDQFGGPKGKKFYKKNLIRLIDSIKTEPMKVQGEIVEQTFQEWKGDEPQVDDVTLIGIEI